MPQNPIFFLVAWWSQVLGFSFGSFPIAVSSRDFHGICYDLASHAGCLQVGCLISFCCEAREQSLSVLCRPCTPHSKALLSLSLPHPPSLRTLNLKTPSLQMSLPAPKKPYAIRKPVSKAIRSFMQGRPALRYQPLPPERVAAQERLFKCLHGNHSKCGP